MMTHLVCARVRAASGARALLAAWVAAGVRGEEGVVNWEAGEEGGGTREKLGATRGRKERPRPQDPCPNWHAPGSRRLPQKQEYTSGYALSSKEARQWGQAQQFWRARMPVRSLPGASTAFA